jgi:hypothetical protein
LKFADDYLFMPLQGATQWDGLSHAWYGETLYNGVPQSEVGSAGTGGARRLGVENVKDSMVGRGVLVDILRCKGGSLPAGYVISRDDVEQTLAKRGTWVQPGDMVLFHTGDLAGYYALEDPVAQLEYLLGAAVGLGPPLVPGFTRPRWRPQPRTRSASRRSTRVARP